MEIYSFPEKAIVVCWDKNAVWRMLWILSLLDDRFSLSPWQSSPPWWRPRFLSLSFCYFMVCSHQLYKNIPCFCLSWHFLSSPPIFPVYEETRISFQPLCLPEKRSLWWYVLLLIKPLFRHLLATIQIEVFYCQKN